MSDSLQSLPADLPIPIDDGACDHLQGITVPSVVLAATNGQAIDLSQCAGTTVLYLYPMTSRPDRTMPTDWNEIPGARGCTPQSCAFRDHHQELATLGASVYGISTQSTEDQREAVGRLHLPFPLLSDANLELASALRLPTFTVDGMTLLKRVTLIIRNGKIVQVFYPVFPPDQNADDVIRWLTEHPQTR